MTQKKSYSRYFIILQEDEKGYALGSDKLPSGYAKLEIKNDKCKISYYVQNLKKESTPYFMVLICNKKDVKKLIRIGEMNIDEYGRTEVSYEYPVENVANCNIGVDKVVGAAIVRFMNTNLISIMSGFTTTDIPEWKSFEISEDENKKLEVKEGERADLKPIAAEKPIESEKPKENIFDKYEMKIEETKKIEEESIREIKDEKDESIDFPVEQTQKEENPINEEKYDSLINEDEYYNNEDTRHKKKDNQDKYEVKIEIEYEKDKKQKVSEDDIYKGSIGDFFKNLVLGFEEIEGHFHEIKRCKWYKIPVNRFEEMHSCHDYNKHTVVYYPMLNYYPYIEKHKHFILGYKFDKDNNMKYLVYGIPGRKARMDQPYGGKSGFVTWIPLTEGDEEENSMGYWLMFYDFNNSTIVIPVK